MRSFLFSFFILTYIFINPNLANSVEFGDKRKVWDFPVEITAKDGSGAPVARAPIYFDGKLAGHTGSKGIFKAILTERHRASIKIGVGKVEGYRLQLKQTTEADFQLMVTNPADPTPSTVKLKVRYKKISQDNLIWVKLECGRAMSCVGIEIKSGDKVVATTNEFGVAHFINTSVPDSRIELLIDTPPPTDEVIFAPSNPTFAFKSSLDPAIYYINESFENAKPRKRVRRAFRGKDSRRKKFRKTKKIRTKKKKKKKKKKGNSAIDLW